MLSVHRDDFAGGFEGVAAHFGEAGSELVALQDGKEALDFRGLQSGVADEEVVLLIPQRDEVEVVGLGGRVDAHAGIGAAVRDRRSDCGVGVLFASVAVDVVRGHALLLEQVVEEDAGAGTLLAVDVPFPDKVLHRVDVLRVPLLDHEALLTDDAADEGDAAVREVLTDIGFVVFSGLRVQKVDAAECGLPCSQRHDGAHGADVGGDDIGPGVLSDEQVRGLVDQRVVGPGDGKAVLQFYLVSLQSDFDGGSGIETFTVLVDDEEAAGLGKAGDDARASRHGDRDILAVSSMTMMPETG